MNLSKSSYVVLIIFLGLVIGCTYDKAEPAPVQATAAVSYSKDILPIIQKNCYICHSATATDPDRPGLYFFDNFDELQKYAMMTSAVNPSYTVLQARLRYIETPGMPYNRARLPDSLIVKIEAWIKGGAIKN